MMKRAMMIVVSFIVIFSLVLTQSGASAISLNPPENYKPPLGEENTASPHYTSGSQILTSTGAALPGSVKEPLSAGAFTGGGSQPPAPGALQDSQGHWYMRSSPGQSAPAASGAPKAPSSTGGPDDFGYIWTDNILASYKIVTNDTGMSGDSDQQSFYIDSATLGFTFPFYEQYLDHLYIAASGYLVMGDADNFPAWDGIGNPYSPNNVIAPYWYHFNLSDTTGNNRVYYGSGYDSGLSMNYFAAMWYRVQGDQGDTYSFEAILYEDGTIDFHYWNFSTPGGYNCGTAGIEDSSGRINLVYLKWCQDPIDLQNNSAIRFTRPASAANLFIYPQYQGQFVNSGNALDFRVPVRNNGDLGTDCYNVTVANTWTVEVLDQFGSPLTDTCGSDGIIDTGDVFQGDPADIIVRVTQPDPVSLGDHDTVEVTFTSTLDDEVSRTTYLSGASPAPFLQAFSDPSINAMDLDYIQPLAQYTLNTTEQQGMGSWSPSVAIGPDGYVYAWDNDRCSQPDCQYNYSEIYVAITDFQGRLLYPLRKVTDHTMLAGHTFDRTVVPVVTSEGNIGLTWLRELRNYDDNSFIHNIYFAMLNPDGTTIMAPTQITDFDTWGWEKEDGGISLESPEIISFADNHMLISWDQITWQSDLDPLHDIVIDVRDEDGDEYSAPWQFTSGDADNHFYHSSQTWLSSSDRSFMSYVHNGLLVFTTFNSSGSLVTGEASITESGDANRPDTVELSTDEILVAWEEISDSREITFDILDGTTYGSTLADPVELTNPANGDNQFVSVTRDGDGHGILTWMDGWRDKLYYALVNNDGTVLTEPMLFKMPSANGDPIWTSQSGAGNAPLDLADDTAPDLWVYSEDQTGYAGSQVRIPLSFGNNNQPYAEDVTLSVTLDDTDPFDDTLRYNWDTYESGPDCTDGVCTWQLYYLNYLETGKIDLFIQLPWEEGPWTVSIEIASPTGDADENNNSLDITIYPTDPPQGDPGTVFRYEDTFGTLMEPYPADEDHFYTPSGITSDASDNIYMAEEYGFRLWKNPQGGTGDQWVVGRPGSPWHHESYLSYPGDVAVEPTSGHAWVVMNTSLKEFDTDGSVIQTLPAENNWEWGQDEYHFANQPLGIAFDASGRMFVADSNNQRIQVYHFTSDPIPAPEYEATIGVTGESRDDNSGFKWPTRIAIDSNYNLYVMDSWNMRVQRCYEESLYSWSCSTYFGITGEWGADDDPDRLSLAVGIGLDAADDVYIADSFNNRMFKCDDAMPPSCTIFTQGAGSGPGEYAWLNDIAIDSLGNVYITDSGNARMQILDSNGVFVDMVGASGVPYVVTEGYYNTPVGIETDGDGNMYIVEQMGMRVVKTDPDGDYIWQAGGLTSDVFYFTGPQGNPGYAAVDDLLFVSDTDNNRIQVFDAATGGDPVYTFGNGGNGNWEFQGPMGIDIRPLEDGHYETYIADAWNHRIQVYNISGYKTTIGWTGVQGYDDDHFNGPRDVAVTEDGIVYVADSDNHRIMKCTTENGYTYDCSVFYGVTAESRSNRDYYVHLNYPISVDVDTDGKVYIADQWAARVQVISPEGEYLTTIGMSWGPDESETWDSGTGEFKDPRGVAIDPDGNVLVADQWNHRIQKFAPGVEGWHQVNLNGFGWTDTYSVTSGTWFNNAGYTATDTDWGAQVWRLDPMGWTQEMTAINGFFDGDNLSIDHMLVFNGYLYASTINAIGSGPYYSNGAQIWRSDTGDDGDWENVVTGGSGSGTPDPANSEFFRMFTLESPERICATTWTNTSLDPFEHAAEIWCSESGDLGSWTSLLGTEDGFGDDGNGGFISTEVFDGSVYVGTMNGSSGAELWRSDDNGTTWEQVNADGFGDIANSVISGLTSLEGWLYTVTHHGKGAGSEVWRCQTCDNTDWEQVVDNGFGNENSRRMPAIEAINGRLILVLGDNYTGIRILASESGDVDSWYSIAPDGLGDGNNLVPWFDNSLVGVMNHIFLGTNSKGNGGELWISNEVPEGAEDGYSTPASQTLSIDAMNGVLDNDSDFEDDDLSAELVDDITPSQGTLSLNDDGSFTYIPAAGFWGNVTFTYRIFDGIDYSDPVTVTITVNPYLSFLPLITKP